MIRQIAPQFFTVDTGNPASSSSRIVTGACLPSGQTRRNFKQLAGLGLSTKPRAVATGYDDWRPHGTPGC